MNYECYYCSDTINLQGTLHAYYTIAHIFKRFALIGDQQ